MRTATGAFVVRAPSFFESEYFYREARRHDAKLPLAAVGRHQGHHQGQLIFTLRKDWTMGDDLYPPGIAARHAARSDSGQAARCPRSRVLYTPGPRVLDRGGRDRPRCGLCRDLRQCHRHRACLRARPDGKWSDKKLDLPAGGSTGIVSANDYGPEAHFTFESFLTPTTLYDFDGKGEPQAIKSLPARFDASGMVKRTVRSHVQGRHEDPLFRGAAEGAERSAPHHPLRLWRVRDFDDARLFRQCRQVVGRQGRHLCAGQYPRRRRVRPGLARRGA